MEIWPLENCIDKPKRCPKSYKLAETQPCSLLLGNNCVQQNIMLRNIYRVFAAEEMYFWRINENFEAGSGAPDKVHMLDKVEGFESSSPRSREGSGQYRERFWRYGKVPGGSEYSVM